MLKSFHDAKLVHPVDKARTFNQRKKHLSSPREKLLRSTKSNATTHGIEHTLLLEDIQIPSYCPVFGLPITLNGDRRTGASVDRVDASKGYVQGNIRVISMEANRLKSNGTIEQFEQILEYMRNNLPEK